MVTATRQPMSIEERTARSYVRAQAEGVKVYRLNDTTYACPSSTALGEAYTVTVSELGVFRNCPAALHGRPCKHQAAVSVRAQVVIQQPALRLSRSGSPT